jgi:D-lactate dehydrogenase (cytochrome)
MIYKIEEKYNEYLSDESKLEGDAISISFPKNSQEVLKIIEECNDSKISITIQGGRSSITGGAVPNNNHILNSLNLTNIEQLNATTIMVESGVNLNSLSAYIERNCKDYFFPVDPTEKTATIGGIIANNSKGPISFYYGNPEDYIEEITVVLSNLSTQTFDKKNSFFSKFFGSEGLYGFIQTAKIRLIKKPSVIWGLTFFFKELNEVCGFTEELKNNTVLNTAKIVCGEFLDSNTIELIDSLKENMTKISSIPSIPEGSNHLVYLEIHSDNEEDLESLIENIMNCAIKNNSDVDVAWAVSELRDLENMRNYRHAAAECTNIILEKRKSEIPNLHKLGLDISIDENIEKTINRDLKSNIQKVLFGHIFSSNLHLNFLPKSSEEFIEAKKVIKKISLEAKSNNAVICTEHGVGKIKKEVFKECISQNVIDEIINTKYLLDKNNLFDPNNII